MTTHRLNQVRAAFETEYPAASRLLKTSLGSDVRAEAVLLYTAFSLGYQWGAGGRRPGRNSQKGRGTEGNT